MKQITVTLDLEDDEAAALEGWKAYHPETNAPLTVQQKVMAVLFNFYATGGYTREPGPLIPDPAVEVSEETYSMLRELAHRHTDPLPDGYKATPRSIAEEILKPALERELGIPKPDIPF